MQKKHLYITGGIGLCVLGLLYGMGIPSKYVKPKSSITIEAISNEKGFPLSVAFQNEKQRPKEKKVILESSQENVSFRIVALDDTKVNLKFSYNPMDKTNGSCPVGEYTSVSINGKEIPNMHRHWSIAHSFSAKQADQFDISAILDNKVDENCVAEYDFNIPVPEQFNIEGLAGIEHWGRWSNGETSKFTFNNLPKDNLVFEFDARPFLFGDKTRQEVVITDKEQNELSKWIFEKDQDFPDTNLVIPSDLIVNGSLELNFHFTDLSSPKELGLNSDTRLLGLGFYSLKIKKDNLKPNE